MKPYFTNSPACWRNCGDGGIPNTTAIEPQKDVVKTMLKVFPNPSSSEITISIGKSVTTRSSPINIVIIRSDGIVVEQLATIREKTVVNISDLSTGIYFIRVSSANWSENIKFIKQ